LQSQNSVESPIFHDGFPEPAEVSDSRKLPGDFGLVGGCSADGHDWPESKKITPDAQDAHDVLRQRQTNQTVKNQKTRLHCSSPKIRGFL